MDLIIELALHQGALRPKENDRWSFGEKKQHATTGAGSGLPVCLDLGIWSRVTRSYAATLEARHSLVHRRFLLSSNGDMCEIRSSNGRTCKSITAAEQEAFCRLAQSLASVTIKGSLVGRDRLDLIWWLDQLSNHHSLPLIGGQRKRQVEIVKTNALWTGVSWEVDLQDAQLSASKAFPERKCFDIEIHFPDTGLPPLVGHLESAPKSPHVVIDPANPPNWAT